jgi:cobalamin synthase
MMTYFSMYVLRMLCIGLLVHFDRISWIVVSLTFGYTIQAWIATREDERGKTFFEIENPERAVYPWIIAVALGIVAGAGYIPFVLAMAVFAYLYATGFNRFYRSLCGSIDGTAIGVAGYLAETLFLFIGLAALVRG